MVEVDEHSPTPEAVVRKRLSALRGLGLQRSAGGGGDPGLHQARVGDADPRLPWSLGRPGKAQIVVKLVVGDAAHRQGPGPGHGLRDLQGAVNGTEVGFDR